jgi:AcrR family transcriptional regulator
MLASIRKWTHASDLSRKSVEPLLEKRFVQADRGTTPSRRPDRRTQRTKDVLRDALLSLLPEVGWDGIDVAMLCERANIGRSTFYLHYQDKAALLRGSFADLQSHLLVSVEPSDQARPYAFLPGLLVHVHEQQEVFRSLLGRRSSQIVQDHMRDILMALFSKAEETGKHPGSPDEARPHMLAGGLMQLMVWWLGTSRQLTPAEVEARFLAFSVGNKTPAG